ncbi:MAG: hypothetical protein ABIT10_11610 [Alteraurantiacibacter sp.]
MATSNKKNRAGDHEPIVQLKVFGEIEDILTSTASLEFKAACIEMELARRARLQEQSEAMG